MAAELRAVVLTVFRETWREVCRSPSPRGDIEACDSAQADPWLAEAWSRGGKVVEYDQLSSSWNLCLCCLWAFMLEIIQAENLWWAPLISFWMRGEIQFHKRYFNPARPERGAWSSEVNCSPQKPNEIKEHDQSLFHVPISWLSYLKVWLDAIPCQLLWRYGIRLLRIHPLIFTSQVSDSRFKIPFWQLLYITLVFHIFTRVSHGPVIPSKLKGMTACFGSLWIWVWEFSLKKSLLFFEGVIRCEAIGFVYRRLRRFFGQIKFQRRDQFHLTAVHLRSLAICHGGLRSKLKTRRKGDHGQMTTLLS